MYYSAYITRNTPEYFRFFSIGGALLVGIPILNLALGLTQDRTPATRFQYAKAVRSCVPLRMVGAG